MKSDTQDVEGAAPKKNKTKHKRGAKRTKKKKENLFTALLLYGPVWHPPEALGLFFPSSWGEPPRKLRKKI